MRDFFFYSPWAFVTRGNYSETHHAAPCITVRCLTAEFPRQTQQSVSPCTCGQTVGCFELGAITDETSTPHLHATFGMGIYFPGV